MWPLSVTVAAPGPCPLTARSSRREGGAGRVRRGRGLLRRRAGGLQCRPDAVLTVFAAEDLPLLI